MGSLHIVDSYYIHPYTMMFQVLVASAVLSLAWTASIPTGVSLAACPDYPFCDLLVDPRTGLLAADPANYPDYISKVGAKLTSFNGYTNTIPASGLPDGIDLAACPNFPF